MKRKQLLFKTLFAAAMLFGSSGAFAQVKIGANPATIDAANNLEVEASTAGRKTSIDKTTGQVTIADGTQKAGRVFTSDGNGGGSWQGNLIFAGYATSQSVGEDNAGNVINIISDFDSESAWNNSTKEYTIPEAGYYSISLSGTNIYADANISQTAPGGFVLFQSGGVVSVTSMPSQPGYDMPVGSSLVVKAITGDKIKLVSTTCVCPGTQTWTMKKATLAITKIH